MADRRHELAAHKRERKPRASPTLRNALPLESHRLPLPSGLAGQIRMMWKALGSEGKQRFLRGPRSSWEAENQRLLEALRARAERADFGWRIRTDREFATVFADDLVKLVERDVRYLTSGLVVGVILLWKLQVIHGFAHGTGKEHKIMAECASKHLGEIARKVSFVTGRGRQEFVNPYHLLATFEENLDAIRNAALMIKRKRRIKPEDVAATTKLPLTTVKAVKDFPKKLTQHAEALTIQQYHHVFGADRLRRLLREARKIVREAEESEMLISQAYS